MLAQWREGSDQAVLYRVMFGYPQVGVEQLGERLGWSTDRVRLTLDQLADLSLVQPSAEQPGAVRAVSPELGLTSLLAVEESELLVRQQQLVAARVAAKEMIQEYADLRSRRPYPAMERLVGWDEIRTRLQELAAGARSELLAFAPGEDVSAELLRETQANDRRILDRGVRMCTVYVKSVYNAPVTLGGARWLIENGARVRTVPSLPMRMTIIDRRVAVLPLDPDDSSSDGLVVHGEGLVTGLCALFDQVWESAGPLDGEEQRCHEELTGQEKELLRLLGYGLTDEVVARKMGISVRTGRRITAELMSRLGARSRFQAGARAREREWLHAD